MSDDVLNTRIQASKLMDMLDILSALVDEAVFHIGKDGVQASVVDPANVAMYRTVELRPPAFEVTPSGSFAIGSNIGRLQDTLGKAADDEVVDLSFNPETRRLNVSYGRVDADLASINPDSIRDEPDVNNIELPNNFGVRVADLADAIDVVQLTGQDASARFVSTNDSVRIEAEGDTDDFTYVLESGDLDQPELTENGVTMLSAEYLEAYLDAIPSGVRDMSMSIGDEFPVEFEYTFADEAGKVQATLAPRLDTS